MGDDDIHVVPVDDYQEHECSPTCWCQPVLNYRDMMTGRAVWNHNRAKDGTQ